MSLNRKTATGREVLASNGDVLVGGRDYEVYSENETMIGYWIDRKPIYRKRITTSPITFNNWITLESNTVYDTITSCRDNAGNDMFCYDLLDDKNKVYCWNDKDTNSLKLWVGQNNKVGISSGQAKNLWIEYTKTTDTPATDTNTYSTTEKITGETWIDGKPIYRKVITGAVPDTSANGTNITGYIGDEILNVDAIVNIGGTVIYNGGNTVQLPWETANGGYRINIAYNITRHQISVTNGAVSYNGAPMTVILEYTKTN